MFEDSGPVGLTISDGLAVITLNRPETLNAIDVPMAKGLAVALNQVVDAGNARALLLRGAGRSFCAGGDISRFRSRSAHAPTADRTMSQFHPAVLTLARLSIPTIASLHGAVAGAGIGLMLACDLAIAAEGTRLTLAYPRIGATIDAGASWFLPRIVGERRAKELALLAPVLDAATAERYGLVNRVVPTDALEKEAFRLANEMAQGPTAAYSAIKRLVDQARSQDLAPHLDAEQSTFVDVASGDDFAEGVEAFLAKRQPKFRGDIP